MKEANIITDFKKWVAKNPQSAYFQEPTCIEFKICKERRFSFSKVEPHQISNLSALPHQPFFYKIQDEPFRGGADSNRFHRAKPFDAFYLPQSKGYIAVCFYIPNKLKRLFFFSVERFVLWQRSHRMKSFTADEAQWKCDFYIDLIKSKIEVMRNADILLESNT